ncbi:MAG: PEP-CTERM sorting domain-containing protein [Alphaproteobacteria bacterium]|nr:PEP-CTERM sorting domain-containing protein [Alphaproteobacteria bacterium]
MSGTANGSEWYFSSGYSWGFAGLGDSVTRGSCDYAGSGERDRLCWHTGGGNINRGWRSGSNTSLNGSTTWERYLLVANDMDVPEPSGLILFGLGLAGLGVTRRRLAA